MVQISVNCEFPGCPFKTPEGELSTVVELLKMHFAARHKPVEKEPSKAAIKLEKAKRPELTLEMSDEDWAYFINRWAAYKKALGLDGEDIVVQLMECCSEDLRKDHFRNYPTFKTSDLEENVLRQIRQVAVRAKNRAVNRFKLHTLKQDKGEPIRRYAGRIRGLASVSEYAVKCGSCQNQVSYTLEIIIDQIISGIADLEIQKDVLSNPEAKNFDLEKLLAFIEGKESGQTSQGLIVGAKVDAVIERKAKRCKFCGDAHVWGKKNCKAAGKTCDKCGKRDHLSKVCKSSKKNVEEVPKIEASFEQLQVKTDATVESNWACGALSGEDFVNESFQSFENEHLGFDVDNKNEDIYSTYFNSTREKINKKVRQYAPMKKALLFESGHPKAKNIKGTSISTYQRLFGLVMILITGSAILSLVPSSQGQVSSVQTVEVSNGSLKLGHHIYNRGKGWLKQAARSKPMVKLYSRLDMSAYKALGIKPPEKQFKVSLGSHLADTGASICLGGRGYLRSLGLSESDLTPCEMSVSSASNASIEVIGGLLIEFSTGENAKDPRTKQVVYICEGVTGVLLSLEACIDLGLVRNNFPNACDSINQVSSKKKDCSCKCPVRETAPDPPKDLPFQVTEQNISKLKQWIL